MDLLEGKPHLLGKTFDFPNQRNTYKDDLMKGISPSLAMSTASPQVKATNQFSFSEIDKSKGGRQR